MTETTGAFTSNGPQHFRLGTVGVPNPGIEVRLADDGEILCRGPVITPGYHRQESATRALIDEDGWLHTGDIGTVDEDGFYSVTDLADLSSKPQIRAMAQAAVDAANERLSRPEQVKAWELLPDEWTAESEELTPTLKLQRRVVNATYSDVVDRLYG